MAIWSLDGTRRSFILLDWVKTPVWAIDRSKITGVYVYYYYLWVDVGVGEVDGALMLVADAWVMDAYCNVRACVQAVYSWW